MKPVAFPYETLEAGLHLTLRDARVDGQVARSVSIDGQHGLVGAHQVPGPWERLGLEALVETDSRALAALEDRSGPTTVLLAANCRGTNLRMGFPLARNGEDGSWLGTLELYRCDFRPRVELKAVLVCRQAESEGRILAVSNRWLTYFDAPESFRIGGALPVRWCDFEAPSAPALAAQYPEAPYVVDLTQSPPELLLNAAFEGLQSILADRRSRVPYDQALHDACRLGIARSVWMALFQEALSGLVDGEDGNDERDWPAVEWQAEVLQAVLREMFPKGSEGELLERAYAIRAGTGSAELVSLAEAAIGRILDGPRIMSGSFRRLVSAGGPA